MADDVTFGEELRTFAGSQFRTIGEREGIEALVQEYLMTPRLHRRERTSTLVYHLLNSEVAPTRRVALTGLDPTGFFVSLWPRLGPWIVYGVSAAFLAACLIGFQLGTPATWVGALLVVLLMLSWIRRWYICHRLVQDIDFSVFREVLSDNFDPLTISERLHRLEGRGLKIHSNVYALLRLQHSSQD